jgi:hypothetical protein
MALILNILCYSWLSSLKDNCLDLPCVLSRPAPDRGRSRQMGLPCLVAFWKKMVCQISVFYVSVDKRDNYNFTWSCHKPSICLSVCVRLQQNFLVSTCPGLQLILSKQRKSKLQHMLMTEHRHFVSKHVEATDQWKDIDYYLVELSTFTCS